MFDPWRLAAGYGAYARKCFGVVARRALWGDDVDAVHRHCLARGVEVTMLPPWAVCDMHIRRPDGYVFRISKGLEGRNGPASARLDLRPLDAGHVLAAPFAERP
jgi:hypothetical protein